MRIIAGLYRGRTISTVDDLSVRPATDRVRESIFNMLSHRLEWEGLQVLDMFAGSGSLGLEALSRGAQHCTFVEKDASALRHLQNNIHSVGCETSATVYEMDAMQILKSSQDSYGLIFADPPYGFPATAEIPARVFRGSLLRSGGYLLIEHEPELSFGESERYRIGPEKKFGRTRITFFHHRLTTS